MSVLVSLIALIINVIAITQSAYKDDKLTCDRYIINSYLYVLLAILIMFFIIVVNDRFRFIQNTLGLMFGSIIYSIIFIIALIFLMYFVKTLDPTKDTVLLHMTWTTIMVILGMLMYPIVAVSSMNNNLGTVLLIVLGIVGLTAYIGIEYGKQIFVYDWDKYLYFALLGFIILTAILMFTRKMSNSLDLFITWGVLIIFIILLMSYNKKLNENSKTCAEHNNPNYLEESLGLITKIINVFARVARLMGRRR